MVRTLNIQSPEHSKKDFLTIFHADDDNDDKELVAGILEELQLPCKLVNVCDGDELLEYLYDEKVNKNFTAMPDVIILDMNMPSVNGIEVLKKIRADGHFRGIPVYFFSNSYYKNDIEATTLLGSSGYFQKTYEHTKWKKAISEICVGAILKKTELQ